MSICCECLLHFKLSSIHAAKKKKTTKFESFLEIKSALHRQLTFTMKYFGACTCFQIFPSACNTRQTSIKQDGRNKSMAGCICRQGRRDISGSSAPDSTFSPASVQSARSHPPTSGSPLSLCGARPTHVGRVTPRTWMNPINLTTNGLTKKQRRCNRLVFFFF